MAPPKDKSKYHLVKKDNETDPVAQEENVIRVSANGRAIGYVGYARKLFDNGHKKISVRGTGTALTTAILTAEYIKRSFEGLHQITEADATDVVDTYEPIDKDAGLETVIDTRKVCYVVIHFSKDPVDEANPGYQPPLGPEAIQKFKDGEWKKSPNKGKGQSSNSTQSREKGVTIGTPTNYKGPGFKGKKGGKGGKGGDVQKGGKIGGNYMGGGKFNDNGGGKGGFGFGKGKGKKGGKGKGKGDKGGKY